jgi:hypothetical protein
MAAALSLRGGRQLFVSLGIPYLIGSRATHSAAITG